MPGLFRVEAVDVDRQRAYGAILLARPLSHTVLTLLFAAFALLLAALLATCSYTRKAKVSGVLLPSHGLIRVVTPQAGRVAERRVQEGQAVKAGEVLFVLVSERASATQGNAEQGISALLQRRRASYLAEREQQRLQLGQRVDAARRKGADLDAERRRVDQQIALQQRRVALADNVLARHVELQASNFVSAATVQDKQSELLDQQQRLADLQRARGAVERELADVQAGIRDQQVQAQRDREAGERDIASTEQELTVNEAQREMLLQAPQDGTVSAITAEPGQALSASQALATLLPAGSELEAELYLPTRAAGFVRPGTPVTLRYQAYAYQKFGQALGRVREVSTSAMRPDEMAAPGAALLASGAAEPLYRVRVQLPRQTVTAFGSPLALKAGAVLDASILLETRRLYEFVLEPLYTLRGQL